MDPIEGLGQHLVLTLEPEPWKGHVYDITKLSTLVRPCVLSFLCLKLPHRSCHIFRCSSSYLNFC